MNRTRLTHLVAAASLSAAGLGLGASTTSAAPLAPAAPKQCTVNKTLGFGQDDPMVVCLKKSLRAHKLLGKPDNGKFYTHHFGWQTRAAVKRLQKQFGLLQTGHADLLVRMLLGIEPINLPL